MRYRQAGFTLIEMLVAMSLVAVLGLMLAGGIGFSQRVAVAATARGERLDQLWTAFAVLRETVGTAEPPVVTASGAVQGFVFKGSPQGSAFMAPAPTRLGLGGSEVVEFRVEGERDARRLVARWTHVSAAAANALDGTRQSILVEGLAEARFSYFGAAPGEAVPSWHSGWDDPKALPALLRLSATFADGTPAQELTAPTRITRRGA